MKNFIKIILAFVAIFMISFSCVRFDEPASSIHMNSKGEYAILFDNSHVMTKATINSVSGNGYDAFSLFTWNSNNDTIMKPYVVKVSGADSYKYDEEPGQELKYFSNNAASYDFIGIIPTDHTMSMKDGVVLVKDLVSFKVDDNRITGTITANSPEEFLWSYKNVAKADYGNIVGLPFNHGNAVIYLGFSSDRNDTELLDYVPGQPAVPAVYDTTFVTSWSSTGLVNRNSDSQPVPNLTDDMITHINSFYTLTASNGTVYDGNDWPSSGSNYTLKVKKDNIPAGYKHTFVIDGKDCTLFDYEKYLTENNVNLPSMWINSGVLVHVKRNSNNTCTGVFLQFSNPVTVTEVTPAQPAIDPIEGVRMFTADSLENEYCKHIAHTVKSDASISANGMVYSNRTASTDVITYSLPATTTLNDVAVWSATTFYALPGDENLNFVVVKLSYTYNGITTYDVRVPIKLPAGGLQAGKYYKYELYITSLGNGTNDPEEAKNEKNEIIIKSNPVIRVKLIDTGYTQGDERTIQI